MEIVIALLLIGGFIIYLYTHSSKKETTSGKLREAISDAAQDAAIGIAKIVEPAQEKKIRLAKEQLALRNGAFYRSNTFDSVADLLEIDEKFRKCLETLGLSENEYKDLSKMMFYIGTIERDKDKDFRRRFITELINDNHNKPYVLELKRALEYFNIPEQEWIDYGGTTLFMHNINKNYLIEKFGYKL